MNISKIGFHPNIILRGKSVRERPTHSDPQEHNIPNSSMVYNLHARLSKKKKSTAIEKYMEED
jgi:hypothetical protein